MAILDYTLLALRFTPNKTLGSLIVCSIINTIIRCVGIAVTVAAIKFGWSLC